MLGAQPASVLMSLPMDHSSSHPHTLASTQSSSFLYQSNSLVRPTHISPSSSMGCLPWWPPALFPVTPPGAGGHPSGIRTHSPFCALGSMPNRGAGKRGPNFLRARPCGHYRHVTVEETGSERGCDLLWSSNKEAQETLPGPAFWLRPPCAGTQQRPPPLPHRLEEQWSRLSPRRQATMGGTWQKRGASPLRFSLSEAGLGRAKNGRAGSCR